MRRYSFLLAMLLAVLVVAGASHRWLALAWNAWRYPQAAATDRTQIAIGRLRAYVAAGTDGIEVVNPATGSRLSLVPPPASADRIDDVVVADGWLFGLDATEPGHLLVYSLQNPDLPAFTGQGVAVPVGPFSGISAAAGVVAVSGGTSRLTLRAYDIAGQLGDHVATADFGRGQPDITLRPDGRLAAVSTHSFGPNFSITLAEVRRSPLGLDAVGRIELPDAGFTKGGYKPAHFPLVSAWLGDRLYVVHGGGLTAFDASDPRHPYVLSDDPGPRPAMDISLAAGNLDLIRAGAHSAIMRYRLDRSGVPRLSAICPLNPTDQPGAIASDGKNLLVTLRHTGLQIVAPTDFSAVDQP